MPDGLGGPNGPPFLMHRQGPDLPDHLRRFLDQGHALRSGGYRGRFAPSPTGVMHLGNLRTALASWLEARRNGGVWLLRIDDLDTPRNRPGAQASIERDLQWLGLDWDGPVICQSQHRGRYHAWLSWLRRSGALFPCRCSRRMLLNHPVYPGTCRDRQTSWGWQGKRLPSWRLRVPDDDPHGSGDVVLRRADGFVAYQLATVLDELCLGITDVVRGEDLHVSLPAQLSVYAAFLQQPPRFLHVPLLLDPHGQKLSKRKASAGLAPLQDAGLDAAAVIGQLAASLSLVEPGARLTALELLQDLTHRSAYAVDS